MKPYQFLVVSAFLALFASVTPVKAVDIMTPAQLLERYPAGYTVDTTFFVQRVAEPLYYFSGDSILNVVPVDDGVITLEFYPDHINIWEIGTDWQLPSESGFSYLVTVWGKGEANWAGLSFYPEEVAVDQGTFTGRVDFALEIGSTATINVVRFHSSVPEPATYASMVGLGLLGFAFWRRKR